jgi:phosphoglycolate phosphatase
MQIKGVIFDLDGTLLDSLGDVADYANAVLGTYGFGLRQKEEYRYLAGQGAYSLLANASGCSDAKLISEMVEEFKKVYEQMQGSAVVYSGIDEMLDMLTAKNIKIAVLSNKPEHLTQRCVQKYFFKHRFEAVYGQRDGKSVKPDPSSALEMAKILNLKPSEIAIVGDTKNDILTAKNGGFYSVGVTWGFRERTELEENGADIVIDEPLELEKALLS